jgi:hypothetical protein
VSPRPTEREETTQQRRTKRSGEMRPAHTPIKAGQTQRSPSGLQLGEIDSHVTAESPALLREHHDLSALTQTMLLLEAIKDVHSQLTGEMVVTHPGLS